MSHARRHKQFVDRVVQGALVRRMAYHWFSFLAVGTALSIALQALTNPFQSLGAHFAEFAQNNMCFLAVIVCMTPIYLWDTVKLSNRFVGPVLRLNRAMHDMNQGQNVEELKFRPGDYWCGLADEFNLLLSRQKASSQPTRVGENGHTESEPSLAGVGEN